MNELIKEIWSRDMSTEVHFLPHFNHNGNNTTSGTTQDDDGSKRCRALASRVVMRSIKWDFLYGRDLVPRSNMAVLLVGPADWVVAVAVQVRFSCHWCSHRCVHAIFVAILIFFFFLAKITRTVVSI